MVLLLFLWILRRWFSTDIKLFTHNEWVDFFLPKILINVLL